jgi:ectoine hydroxylase-related dioxygenase (phytanoyl-CoA dioxygenase family)
VQATEPQAVQSLACDGYAVISNVLNSRDTDEIVRAIGGMLRTDPGIRSLLEVEWCALLAERVAGDPRIREFLPVNARAVQCTLFAKTPESNWLVSLHQDLSIPVPERIESAACSGWSQKQGDTYVQPPASVLENILAVRHHLDDCDERNGALRVVPGSHRLGRLSSDEAHREREVRGERLISVSKGSALVMRPLLLHASSKSSAASPRRVLRFVYGPAAVPEGLRWPTRKQSPVTVS